MSEKLLNYITWGVGPYKAIQSHTKSYRLIPIHKGLSTFHPFLNQNQYKIIKKTTETKKKNKLAWSVLVNYLVKRKNIQSIKSCIFSIYLKNGFNFRLKSEIFFPKCLKREEINLIINVLNVFALKNQNWVLIGF